MKKTFKILGIGLAALLLLSIVGFVIWASLPLSPQALALENLESDQIVSVQDDNDWLVFSPQGSQPGTGFIFYPGGRVDYQAYALHASQIARAGYTVVVVRMPLNFAFLGLNKAEAVIQNFPNIETWAVGGHSLGGAMAAEFAFENPSRVQGLVLWAAYPADNTDLTNANLNVLSISASNDGLATPVEIQESRQRLPETTEFIEIQGGNHAGFGWYGVQSGDSALEIEKSDQMEQVVLATTAFLDSLSK